MGRKRMTATMSRSLSPPNNRYARSTTTTTMNAVARALIDLDGYTHAI
jgi:hypothetical protein